MIDMASVKRAIERGGHVHVVASCEERAIVLRKMIREMFREWNHDFPVPPTQVFVRVRPPLETVVHVSHDPRAPDTVRFNWIEIEFHPTETFLEDASC